MIRKGFLNRNSPVYCIFQNRKLWAVSLNIELLLDHQYLIPEIVELKFQQFGYLVPEKTLQDFKNGLEAHLNDQKLPIAYVIVENKQFIGTFSLRKCDMDTHQHLSPWVGSVLVHPSKRKRGIGAFLVQKAEMTANELGYNHLYLFTPDKAAWYAKLGWQTLEHTLFNKEPVTVMEKSLNRVHLDSSYAV